jgi:hypothetical protein
MASSVTGMQGRHKELGNDSVLNILPVNPMKIFLHPRHINLELINCLVKAMAETNSYGFNKFPNINSAALKEGIFVGICTREIMGSLIDTEQATLESLK